MSQLVNNLELLKLFSNATSELVKKISKSVVSINTRMSQGTGIVFDKQGHIVTCNHVLSGSNQILIGSGEKTFEARAIGVDPYNDLALLKADQENIEPIEMGDSDTLSTGQFILALANPFNHRQPTATTGIITNPDSTIRGFRGTCMENVIATDAKLNPGFSGGPLVDAEGKVVGINAAYVWQRGIAIPINKVKHITNRMLSGGKIKRAYLGLKGNTVPIPEEIQNETGIEQNTGVMVFQVESDGPAKRSGLKMGDVIVKLGGKKVNDFYDLPRILSSDIINKETTVKVLREERLLDLAIIPTEKEVTEDD
jgi:S1-C subfamily serine protease